MTQCNNDGARRGIRTPTVARPPLKRLRLPFPPSERRGPEDRDFPGADETVLFWLASNVRLRRRRSTRRHPASRHSRPLACYRSNDPRRCARRSYRNLGEVCTAVDKRPPVNRTAYRRVPARGRWVRPSQLLWIGSRLAGGDAEPAPALPANRPARAARTTPAGAATLPRSIDGAREETRTPTPKRLGLNQVRLPIPPLARCLLVRTAGIEPAWLPGGF